MMSDPKHWQVKIWTGKTYEEPISIYSETLANLPIEAEKWLQENPPLDFSNAQPGFDIKRRVSYVHSDGSLQPVFPFESEPLEEGWYYVTGEWGRPEKLENYDDVIQHYVQETFIPEKGPDYKEIPLTESNFPIHLIKTLKRESNELKTNDMLQRGWYIVSLDFDGKQDYYGNKVVSRTTIFVLGHPEENAF